MKFQFVGLAAVFVFVLFLAGCKVGGPQLTIVSEQGNIDIRIEVAKTGEEKRVGLMGREELADHTGMLFVYDEVSKPVMWMKDMLIPIDIVFIGEDKRIDYIESSVPPCEPEDYGQCERYGSLSRSSWVLELPAGYTMRNGIKQGDEVLIPSGI